MNDYRINFQLPAVSPGPAIKQEKPEQVCEFREFETKIYGAAQLGRPGATKQSIEKEGSTAERPDADSAAVAAPPQSKWTPKVGDRVRFIHPGSRVHGHTGKLLRLYKKMGYECCDIEWDDGDRDQFGWLTSLELLP